jgi:hypothetical protein
MKRAMTASQPSSLNRPLPKPPVLVDAAENFLEMSKRGRAKRHQYEGVKSCGLTTNKNETKKRQSTMKNIQAVKFRFSFLVEALNSAWEGRFNEP